jgi:ferredoxin
VDGVDDLPSGWHDEQSPGSYRLTRGDDDALFDWAVGPASWKSAFFPPSEELWRATPGEDGPEIVEPPLAAAPVAVIGARPCEVAAMAVLDRVLSGGAVPDAGYVARRRDAFVVVAECGSPAGTCFCTSMGTGPSAGAGYDLALTELPRLPGTDGHRLLVRVGTERGGEVLGGLPRRPPTADEAAERDRVVAGAVGRIGRALDTDGLPGLLARNLDHPRWEEVAERCLSCGNCTLVCPTCFCSDVDDVSDLDGTVTRRRSWASCFDRDHSFIHGGPVRPDTRSAYRQWLTHKLSTWWDQFDTSGCVGCGRCIAWCPVGIDLTEEAAAIRAGDGERAGGARA